MLIWNVYIGNHNKKEITTYNVFAHSGFLGSCIAVAKKYKEDREQFANELYKNLMYYYWSKCEWEVVLTLWPPRTDDNGEKIDVFQQVRINWDHFVDYVWNNKEELAA